MSRPECKGVKEDESDRCDFYDTEGYCKWYGDTWLDEKDDVYRGGEDVEYITYCTHRAYKGVPVNWGTNPLHMERIPRWNEVVFMGNIRMCHHELYNPSGIIVWGDDNPRMEDPVSEMIQYPDGRTETMEERWEHENADWLEHLREKHTKDISNVRKENMILNPIYHVDGD